MRGLEWHYGNVLLTEYDADGFLGLQIDAYGDEKSGVPTFQQVHPGGVIHRPRDPDDSGRAGTLYFWEGPQGFAFSVSDPRSVADLPELAKGSTCVYAHRAPGSKSYVLVDAGSGDITIKTQGGTSAEIKIPGNGGDIIANGAKITAIGDVVTATGVSLANHMTPSPFGPLGPPTPSA